MTVQATILFADIAGSTAMYERLGDQRAEAIISEVLQALSVISEKTGGQVIKTIGDEIMCRFSEADQAIFAARQMQEFAGRYSPPGVKGRVAVRIGAHHGPVLDSEADVHGDTVNVSARVAALARPSKIMITAATVDELSMPNQSLCRPMQQANLKGKKEAVQLYDVIWEQNEELTRVTQSIRRPSVSTKTLLLSAPGKEISLSNAKPTQLMIGRGNECQLQVGAPQASRLHCEIIVQGGKFLLQDHSTNGTYIEQNGVEMWFHQESAPLLGHGVISIGAKAGENPDFLLHYRIE